MNTWDIKIINGVHVVYSVVFTVLDGLWKILHDGMLVRRAVLFWTLYVYAYVLFKVMDWMFVVERSGTDIAAIVAAIMTPLSALTGAVFAFYNNSKKFQGQETEVVDRRIDGRVK